MFDYYEVELAKSREYDHTLGGTVSIGVFSDTCPEPDDIEKYLVSTNSRFRHLKVCFISDPLGEKEIRDIIPYVEEVIDRDDLESIEPER